MKNSRLPLQVFSREKLRWLEEANALATKALGFEKRALCDERFSGMKK